MSLITNQGQEYNLNMESQIRKSIIFLSCFGILLASYLSYNYLFQPTYRLCTISQTVNCDAVISGSVSTTLGIPTALYGLVGYVVILFGAFKNKWKLVLGMATFGTLFCLRLTYIEIFQLKVICPVCLMCQLTMVGILGLSLVKGKRP
jgi:uncharacterized membrane protein